MNAQPKSAMERVRNPQGRADWLAANLLKEAVKRTNDPVLKVAHVVSRNEVEDLLKRVLGPKTAAGRSVKRLIEIGREVAQELAQ
jgi:hypothetical protein